MASDAPGTETEADGDVQDATSHDTTQATPNTVAGSPIGGTPQEPCLVTFQDVLAVVEDEERGLARVRGYLLSCGGIPIAGFEVTVLSSTGEVRKAVTDMRGCFQATLPGMLGNALTVELATVPPSTAVVSLKEDFVSCDPPALQMPEAKTYEMREVKRYEIKKEEINRTPKRKSIEPPFEIKPEPPFQIKNEFKIGPR